MRLGFIGTGLMGSAMAANLMKAGHDLTVHDARKEAADDLVKAGAKWADSPQEVAYGSEVILLSLPGPIEVEEVVLKERGVLAGAGNGAFLIDLSTNSPGVVRRIAAVAREKGVDLLEAPVSGGPGGAKAGTLTIMVGGDKRDFERGLKILEILGKDVIHVGELGMGNSAKLIHNMLSQVHVHAIAEAMALGAKLGMDLKKLHEVLSSGMASSRTLTEKYAQYGLMGNFEGGFRMDLSYKDIALATTLGREAGVPLYFGALLLQRIVDCQARGLGNKDVTAALKPFEELLNVRIRI